MNLFYTTVHHPYSDHTYHHGEVSKRLYLKFIATQKFDLYGRRIYTHETEQLTKKERKVIDLLSKGAPPSERSTNTPSAFQQRARSELIGYDEVYNAPVGFKRISTLIPKSQGNDVQYSYVGQWKDGTMHGVGTYNFKDGETYQGEFRNNAPHGKGSAQYTCEGSYEGEWKDFLYDGVGMMRLADEAVVYTGQFSIGRREGRGKLELSCGVVYEGEYLNGKPHGRGVMSSTLTGYSFEGTFDRY
jgi:hypothetical protein